MARRGGYTLLGYVERPEVVRHWCKYAFGEWWQIGWLGLGVAGECCPMMRDMKEADRG